MDRDQRKGITSVSHTPS